MHYVVNMIDYEGGLESAIQYYHSKWGNEKNYAFFHDAISHSTKEGSGLPRFFALVKDGKLCGCCGLIVNDFISRHDLTPWLAGIYVDPEERGKALGDVLMKYAADEARKMGYSQLYLTTDHDGYYEKFGWERIEDGYEVSGAPTRIYRQSL